MYRISIKSVVLKIIPSVNYTSSKFSDIIIRKLKLLISYRKTVVVLNNSSSNVVFVMYNLKASTSWHSSDR